MNSAVLPAQVREWLEGRLPDWLDAQYWETPEQLVELAPQAQIGWFDMHDKRAPLAAIAAARGLRWLNSSYVGVDWMPLDELAQRGVQITNGAGLTTAQVAEYAVLGMLSMAKNYPAVVRAQDWHEWLPMAPGVRDLAGSRALILGYGKIGQAIARILRGLDVEVVPVSRSGAEGSLTPDQWRAELNTFDWVILSLPGTPETHGLIGAAELAAMKPEAMLVNFARADVVDQAALTSALREKRIAGAVLDLAYPEPLPPEHELWSLDNVQITMHISGRPTPQSQQRAARRFLGNCERFRMGEALEGRIDLARGY